MIEIDRYVDKSGNCPYDEWFSSLERNVKARIIEVLGRLEEGNLSMMKGIGQGVLELRFHFGQVTGSIAARTGIGSSYFSAEAARSDNKMTSKDHNRHGKTTRDERQ